MLSVVYNFKSMFHHSVLGGPKNTIYKSSMCHVWIFAAPAARARVRVRASFSCRQRHPVAPHLVLALTLTLALALAAGDAKTQKWHIEDLKIVFFGPPISFELVKNKY